MQHAAPFSLFPFATRTVLVPVSSWHNRQRRSPVPGFTVNIRLRVGGRLLVPHHRLPAPALGCVLLKQESDLLSADGTLVSRKLTEATAVTRGEPDAATFVVPEQYREAPPSEVYEAELGYRGERSRDCARSTGARADERYYRLRSERSRR